MCIIIIDRFACCEQIQNIAQFLVRAAFNGNVCDQKKTSQTIQIIDIKDICKCWLRIDQNSASLRNKWNSDVISRCILRQTKCTVDEMQGKKTQHEYVEIVSICVCQKKGKENQQK